MESAGSTSPLFRVSQLLRERNEIDAQLGALIKRPPSPGHLGEWIAAQIFDITLEERANEAAIDGRFASGGLKGQTVNIKWYSKRSGNLDLSVSAHPDYYLVLTGPIARAGSSTGQLAPARIEAVYLFHGASLAADLVSRGRRIGTASSVLNALWDAAEIYPRSLNSIFSVTAAQTSALRLFAF